MKVNLRKQKQKQGCVNLIVSLMSGSFLIKKLVPLFGLLGIFLSWYFNKSVLWAIFHFFFGFWYTVYCILSGRFADGGFMEIVNYYF